jgi:AcrR family transcriptional regulator
MELQAADSPRLKVIQRARAAFFREGYSRMTMTALADACGLTRRGLYHHFKNKDDIFRAIIVRGNQEAFESGEWAARAMLARGGNALDVVAEWLDTRFGNVRCGVSSSPHGDELNAMAFKIANDIMIEVSKETNAELARLIGDLAARGLLHLKPGMTLQETAQLIGDGARGVNQARPPIPSGQIAARYRRMAEAILYGCATPGDAP